MSRCIVYKKRLTYILVIIIWYHLKHMCNIELKGSLILDETNSLAFLSLCFLKLSSVNKKRSRVKTFYNAVDLFILIQSCSNV